MGAGSTIGLPGHVVVDDIISKHQLQKGENKKFMITMLLFDDLRDFVIRGHGLLVLLV